MSAPCPHPDYPLEATADEARLGLAVRSVYRLVEPDYEDYWTLAVCKVLSSSDIVVKTRWFESVAYQHLRYGWVAGCESLPPDWKPVGNPYLDCHKAIFEASIQASEQDGPTIIAATGQVAQP